MEMAHPLGSMNLFSDLNGNVCIRVLPDDGARVKKTGHRTHQNQQDSPFRDHE